MSYPSAAWSSRVPFEADRVDAVVGTSSAGELTQRLPDVTLLVVDRVGRAGAFARHPQAVREAIDGDHAFGAEQVRALDRELADRPAAPDGDDVSRLDAAGLGGHVARRKDVRQEEHLLVTE